MNTSLYCDDCLNVLKTLETESVDLFYIDPPFFTQRVHAMTTRDGAAHYSFRDMWASREYYGDFLIGRLRECRRCLKNTGSLFFHCDDNSEHIARLVLDGIFGADNFQSQIIWNYRRWSNSKKGLLPSHQTILFYSQSAAFKFNTLTTSYSESTNLDQILQKRVRDDRGKAVYARDQDGEPVTNGAKRGVPLGDVWDIPYLNPKATERVGYPTQKPVLLMERIINLCTDRDDLVVDPFCGSGTTLVASQLLNRRAIGIDISPAAIDLSRERLAKPIKSESRLLTQGRDSYVRPDLDILECLQGISYHPVHRNNGIDAILTREWYGKPVCIRIQREDETIDDAANALSRAGAGKGGAKLMLIVVKPNNWGLLGTSRIPADVTLVQSTTAAIQHALALQNDDVQCAEAGSRISS